MGKPEYSAKYNKVSLKWVPGQGIQIYKVKKQLIALHNTMQSHHWSCQDRTLTYQKCYQRLGSDCGGTSIILYHKMLKGCPNLPIPELRLVTGLLTGHSPLRYHLKNMAKFDSDIVGFGYKPKS